MRIARVFDAAGQPSAVLDPHARLGGRGAYLCRAPDGERLLSTACLERAQRRRGVARALRAAVALDASS